MQLKLYNTMSRSLEEFEPLEPGKVGMYCCGPTVYDYAHIGNLRTYVFEDVLRRTFEYSGFKVSHVMNVTDVGHLTGDDDSGDDKMVKSAEERNQSVMDVARFYTDAFFADAARLNITRPTTVCPATEHIGDMIGLIGRIEAGGFTYMAGGNLYFDVSRLPDYGKLARLNLDDLKSGARIEVDANKRNPQDFVLWFTKSKFENQALVWDSPWGRGYPGWHIECSAMSIKYLGETFDLHAGGEDHVSVHHTNEIAQSEAATGKPWVRYWLHAKFLLMDKAKMSKSKGGFITLQTLLDAGYEALDYRYFCLGGHYRSQLSFSYESLDAARSARKTLTERILSLREQAEPAALGNLAPAARAYLDSFEANAMEDLAMPRCLSDLWGLVRDSAVKPADVLCAAFQMDRILGLGLAGLTRPESGLNAQAVGEIDSLVRERNEAKRNKDFGRADEIRDILKKKGIAVYDTPQGPRWKVER